MKLHFAALLLFFTSLAQAHHSFTMFDRSKTLTVSGIVRSLQWTNPHVWLWLDVPEADGSFTAYSFEGGTPAEMTRTGGWIKHSVNAGDKITVEFAPMRDGRPGGSLGRVTLANGKTLGGNSASAPLPVLRTPSDPPCNSATSCR